MRVGAQRNGSRLVSWYLQRGAEDHNLMGSTALGSLSPGGSCIGDGAVRGCSLYLHGVKMRIRAPAAHLQSFSHFSAPKQALGGGQLAS